MSYKIYIHCIWKKMHRYSYKTDRIWKLQNLYSLLKTYMYVVDFSKIALKNSDKLFPNKLLDQEAKYEKFLFLKYLEQY